MVAIRRRMHVERCRVTLNGLGGLHMGNPGFTRFPGASDGAQRSRLCRAARQHRGNLQEARGPGTRDRDTYPVTNARDGELDRHNDVFSGTSAERDGC